MPRKLTEMLTSRRGLLAGAAALALSAGTVGIVAAQQDKLPRPFTVRVPPPLELGARHEKLMEAVAARLGVTREQLDQAFDEARSEVGLPRGDFLLPASMAGVAGIERITLAVKPGEGKPAIYISSDTDDEAAAKAIGISVEQLRRETADKSLAEVARAHGVDPKTVVDALKADALARIEKGEKDGTIPADMAERMRQDVVGMIEQLVDRKPGEHVFPGAKIELRRFHLEKP